MGGFYKKKGGARELLAKERKDYSVSAENLQTKHAAHEGILLQGEVEETGHAVGVFHIQFV